ncbi:hypothetical protein BWQ96_01131 [Gracilariopsis chorda]|uniref:Uncharacterized protein n=1 Tax=Gracilariopsis chorda TaxID=448386 RepID=A0A2V3J3V5_9FLOR|nr:hypothetical protein BWQ96_01131 [Gracilariopsis chorda]|eukprot:PXF48993.1 hypothetical protein BWQ96_01131 [Gracilariopsis chorda]
MKADGSIKQNGGVLNIAFIPPFVISDDAEEQVSIDKTSRVRAGLWKEASRFDWDSRSRILQLLFVMAAFCATLTGWIGSSDCYSPEAVIAIWKRFADPSFCTSTMHPEHTSSPQDIRQGWEIAVKVIKSNVGELYHDKEKPIPPRLRRWGRQTEFAVRLPDVQSRTVSWCAQLMQEMCFLTYNRLSERFKNLDAQFLKQFATQAEEAYTVLLEREIGIALDQSPNWKESFSEEKVLRDFCDHRDSNGAMNQHSENSSGSAASESEQDDAQNSRSEDNEPQNTHSEHDHDRMEVDTEQRKHGEQEDVLSPISPDVDTLRDTKLNRREAGMSLEQGSSDQNKIKPSKGVANTEDPMHDASNEKCDDPSPALFKKLGERIREEGTKAIRSKLQNYAEDVSDFDDVQLHQNAQVQYRSSGTLSRRGQGREENGSDEDEVRAPNHQENQDRLGAQESFENHRVNAVQPNTMGSVRAVSNPPKKKARTRLHQNGYRSTGNEVEEQPGQRTRAKSYGSHGNHHGGMVTPDDPEEFRHKDTSTAQPSKANSLKYRHGHGHEPPLTKGDDAINEEPTGKEEEVTESHHKRLVERIALQVRKEALLRRQRGDMVERHGKHIIVPPRKRPQYLKTFQ